MYAMAHSPSCMFRHAGRRPRSQHLKIESLSLKELKTLNLFSDVFLSAVIVFLLHCCYVSCLNLIWMERENLRVGESWTSVINTVAEVGKREWEAAGRGREFDRGGGWGWGWKKLLRTAFVLLLWSCLSWSCLYWSCSQHFGAVFSWLSSTVTNIDPELWMSY